MLKSTKVMIGRRLYEIYKRVDHKENISNFPAILIEEKPLQYLLGYDVELSCKVDNYLINKTWHEVDWFFIDNNFRDSCFISSMLSINSYRKIFPSLLVFCLSNAIARETLIIDSFINYDLNINTEFNNSDRLEFFFSLTYDQAHCVAMVLYYAFLADEDMAFKEALDSYWLDFLKSEDEVLLN